MEGSRNKEEMGKGEAFEMMVGVGQACHCLASIASLLSFPPLKIGRRFEGRQCGHLRLAAARFTSGKA
jgi:hypothetical protein